MGEKYRACRERGVKTAGGLHKGTVMHSLKILTVEIWGFAIFYIYFFLSASLHALAHCCPGTTVTKNRDSQVNRLQRHRSNTDVSVFNIAWIILAGGQMPHIAFA